MFVEKSDICSFNVGRKLIGFVDFFSHTLDMLSVQTWITVEMLQIGGAVLYGRLM